MKKIAGVLFPLVMIMALSACGNHVQSENSKETAAVEAEQPEKVQSITTTTQGTEGQSDDPQGAAQEIEAARPENNSREQQEAEMDTKTLVVYFSCTGTTKLVAEYVAEVSGAAIYEIIPENPYTEADLAYYTNGRADQEQNDPNMRPAISGIVENIDKYETIFLGYPIWHGQAPRIISTFLESYDFSEKIIIPFCTSHSSGIGSSADKLHALCSDSAEWMDGRRFDAESSKADVENWIGEIGIE